MLDWWMEDVTYRVWLCEPCRRGSASIDHLVALCLCCTTKSQALSWIQDAAEVLWRPMTVTYSFLFYFIINFSFLTINSL